MRKKEVVPKQIYDTERGVDTDAKDLINLVVVGHVDSGKSTLMGHLLFDLGQGMFIRNIHYFCNSVNNWILISQSAF